MFVFVSLVLAQLVRIHHVLRPFEEYHLVERLTIQALGWAVLVGLGYTALEPLVRRRWPRTLTGWHRVLAGRFSDPLVGRDLLLGGLFGLAIAQVAGSPLVPAWSARGLLGLILGVSFWAILVATFTVLLVLLLFLVVRRLWLAMLVAGVPFFLPALGLRPDLRHAAVAVLVASACVVVPIRLGVLAASIMCFFWIIVDALAPFSQVSAWYAGTSISGALFLVGLLLYGFHISLAGRPYFGAVLDD